MSNHDYNIANADGATVRADINAALEAVVTNNSGSLPPPTTFPHMWWYDTSSSPALLKRRNAANTAWLDFVSEAEITTSTGTQALAEALNTRVIYAENIASLPTGAIVPDGQSALVLGDGQYVYDAVAATWSRDARPLIPVTLFGAKAEAGFDSTAAFQQSADTLGYVAIPATSVPFEIDSITTTVQTHFVAPQGAAKIKLRTPAAVNSIGFALTENGSTLGAVGMIHIDTNNTSRTAVKLLGNSCYAKFSNENVNANSDSTTETSSLEVTGNDCGFDVSCKTAANTGQPNPSVPRVATVHFTASDYRGRVKGENVYGLFANGTATGAGRLYSVEGVNCTDNGIYNLGGGLLTVDDFVFRGVDEALVCEGNVVVENMTTYGKCVPVEWENCESLVVKNLTILRDQNGNSATTIAAARTGNVSSGP
ncbi:MAG TPA: hypothetical protein VFM75_11445, partial [Modicisalibacter sp.]|nr:hypothetical protein [Modicisalibacter sp.]